MTAIDSDAHVVESMATWDYLAPEHAQYRPAIVSPGAEDTRQYWLIDGKIRGFARQVLTAKAVEAIKEASGRLLDVPEESRGAENVQVRLQHMDQLGVDIEVLHTTIFIQQVTDRPEIEVALCRSWNRWLADIWRKGKGRLRWSCVLPLLTMPEALRELQFAKQNGACAVFMRPLEGNRFLYDPYFYPLYEEASLLNMPMAVHVSNANPAMVDLISGSNPPGAGFPLFIAPVVIAAHELIMSEVPRLFPSLRWGFIEACAQWLPWVISEARRRYRTKGRKFPENVLQEYNMYVACQTNDDLPFIIKYAGSDNILIGTDYGHTDQSSELDAIDVLRRTAAVGADIIDKIVDQNPRAYYGL